MQPYNKISPSHQMQMEIQLHHPLQITQKQAVTEKEIYRQDQEVCVSSCMIHADFVMDICTDHSAEGHPILIIPFLVRNNIIPECMDSLSVMQ